MEMRNKMDDGMQREMSSTAKIEILNRIAMQGEWSDVVDLRGVAVGVGGGGGSGGRVKISHDYDFQNKILKNINFTGSAFSCSFNNSKIENNIFSKCKFDNCRMSRAFVARSDLSGSKHISPWLDGACFDECNWSNSEINGRTKMILHDAGKKIHFNKCNFYKTKIVNLKLRGVVFINCNFDECQINNCMVFNWQFKLGGPKIDQFAHCEFRGINSGIILK